jgi:hypothetical protein
LKTTTRNLPHPSRVYQFLTATRKKSTKTRDFKEGRGMRVGAGPQVFDQPY